MEGLAATNVTNTYSNSSNTTTHYYDGVMNASKKKKTPVSNKTKSTKKVKK